MKLNSVLGLTVTDRRGRYLGIIVEETPGFPECVTIRVWDPYFGKYLLFPKHYKLLLQVTADNWWNIEDPKYQEMLREVVAEAALATHDKDWFEDIWGKKPQEK